MKSKLLIPFLALFALFSANSYPQCSDAGICVIGKRNSEVTANIYNNKITVDYNIGFSGKDGGGFVVNTLTLASDFHLYKTLRTEFILPYKIVSGPVATERGFDDMTLLFTGDLPIPGIGALSASIGAKFSSGSSNKDGLWQAYQPALGSTDLLFGVGTRFGLVNLYLGYQKVFGRNDNSYTRLKRGDDLLFRFGMTEPYKKFTFQGEVLVIKRIQKSNILVYGSNPEQYTDVDGSNELQVNLLARLGYMISPTMRFESYAALPLLKRTYNIDGLKRVFSFSASLTYLFRLE